MWRQTCDASHSFLQPAGLDLGKSLVEAQEAVQRHLGLVVIIHLRTHSDQASGIHVGVCLQINEPLLLCSAG